MIIGVKISKFKCFNGEYIPLTNKDGSKYCGLIGLNGVGKSAVLEALSGYFNKNHVDYNIRIVYMFELESFIRQAKLTGKEIEFVNEYYERVQFFFANYRFYDDDNDLIWKIIKKQCSNWNIKGKIIFISSCSYIPPIEKFNYIERDILKRWPEEDRHKYYVAQRKEYNKEDMFKDMLDVILKKLRCMTTFVFVSKNITPEQFLQIGNPTLQNLIGTELIDYIARLLPTDNVNKMTDVLRNFVKKLHENCLIITLKFLTKKDFQS